MIRIRHLDKSVGTILRNESRIEETVRLMKKYNNNKEQVADEMGISVSTVERNIRKYNERNM